MPAGSTPLARLPILFGLLTLLYLTYAILSPFFTSVAWAAILVFVSWPLYTRLLRRLGGRKNLAATIMTLLLTVTMVGPMAWLLLLLQSEVRVIYAHLGEFLALDALPLPPLIHERLPWLARELERLWVVLHDNPAAFKDNIRGALNLGLSQVGTLAGGIGRNIAKLMFTVLTAFFFYRDGLAIIMQLRQALAHMTPHQGERYLNAAGDMTRAVVFGIVLTALAQSAFAGIGYAVAGAPNPVFLTLVTFLFALIPFGTPFAWGAVALWLLASGDTLAATGLVIWGTVVVGSIDNIIRPLVISTATQISFLLIMFGVLGGLAAFGMIGLFLGPVILAVAIAIWKQWLDQPVPQDDAGEAP